MPVHADHWNELDADDFDDFHQHVRDVMAHAEKHKIRTPALAVKHYTDTISAKWDAERRKHLH